MHTPLSYKTGIRCCAFTLTGAEAGDGMTAASNASRVPLLERHEVPSDVAQLYDK